MCKYCKNLYTSRLNEELIDYPIFKVGKKWVMGNQIYIDEDYEKGNGAFLVARIYDNINNTLYAKKIRIKYCPVCGRKLTEIES